MQIIISLLIAVLFYKIKLIDDRKANNREKLKLFLKRLGRIKTGAEDIYEQDLWLEKDTHINLMAQYESLDNNSKCAVLDYYKDYVDNEHTRNILIYLITLNIIYLLVADSFKYNSLLINTILALCSIILCLKPSHTTLFNNAIFNISNSEIARNIRGKIEKNLQHKLLEIRKKYGVKNMKHLLCINRMAVIIKPKQPLYDWVKSHDPDFEPFQDDNDDKNIYLLSQEDGADWDKYLKRYYSDIFENELSGWYTDPVMWPKVRSWQVFQEWFDFEFQTMIFDLVEEPVEKDA